MRHKIVQGECLSSIGATYGFTWQTLWDHPENKDLKTTRKNPNVLLPGDLLYIPELAVKQADGGTQSRHRFKRKDVPAKLKVQLLLNGVPRSGKKYGLFLDGGSRVTGTTNGKGVIDVAIPPHAQEAHLYLQDGEHEDVYLLKLGDIDPVDSQSGAMQRLLNLGYPSKRDFKAAVSFFQHASRLKETGIMDKETEQKLQETHGL